MSVRAVIGLTPTYLSIHDIRVRRGRRRFQAVSYFVSAVSPTTGKRVTISYIINIPIWYSVNTKFTWSLINSRSLFSTTDLTDANRFQ